MPVNSRLPIIVACLATALALGACGKSADEETGGLLVSEDTLLRYVPADSPYVLANVRPFPDPLLDRLEPRIEAVLEAYRSVLSHTVAAAAAEADASGADAPEVEELTAVITELGSLLSIEGLRQAGIDRSSTAVLYGHGLLPVFRMTLTDAALFEAEVVRIEEQVGQAMSILAVGEQPVRVVDAGQARVMLAIANDQLVVTLAPKSFGDEQLQELLGLTLPASSIAKDGRLATLAETYGYTDYLVGFADISAMVETVVGDPEGLDAALFEATGTDAMRAQLTESCRDDFRSLAGIAPRLVTGYTAVSADAIESHAIVEVRSDLAAGLKTLPASVPGLGSDPGGLASFGMSLDVRAAREFYEARLDAMEAEPFRCELLAPLQLSVASGRQVLQQPVPPMVYDFRGLLAVVTAIEGMDFARNQPPTRIDGRLLLSMENAPAFLALGQMFSPDLATLEIEPDGQSVPLALPQLLAVTDSALIALTQDALALAVGLDGAAALEAMLGAEPGDDGTLMSIGMDAGRYYGFMGQAVMIDGVEGDDQMPPEVRDSVNRMMTAFSELYDRIWMNVRLTGRGVEVESTVSIKE